MNLKDSLSQTAQRLRRSSIREGKPFLLGATWDGLGVNFALFSAHATKVELCLFDERANAKSSAPSKGFPRAGKGGFQDKRASPAERTMIKTPNESHSSLTARFRRFIEGLGPYQSLVLLLVPTSVVEPLKLVAVAVAGDGHWITGTIMIIFAYAASLLVVERLFRIVKAKLLTLPWFARTWYWLIALSMKAAARFRRV